MTDRRFSSFITEFLRALSDVQFQHIVTTRMLPTIYVFGVIFAALASVFLVVNTWNENTWPSRFLYMGLFAPALFVGVVTTWRVLLELCLSIFDITVRIHVMQEDLRKVSGVTDEIATDLPRIQFWRGRRSTRSSSEEEENTPGSESRKS